MLLLYHSHKHISYPIRTIARSAIKSDRDSRNKVDKPKRHHVFRRVC
ncbi:hypothetical protein OZD68_04765 [Wolbachia endosymbiont of Drosophila bicornuta]|nr:MULTISPECIES: hypothetical protein [Wolbachia]MBA8755226.1 hypothetical protein [Wolbachia pipientis]MDE5056881.1 hypothetical protein [Wolbachia endosymbiont of Drosophila bicornuta]